MSVQYTLLGFLYEAPNYGYELKKLHDKVFGKNKPILSGQVYSTLGRLERDGKVQEAPSSGESGGPERIKYKITPRGRVALKAWLNTPEETAELLHVTMYIKTVIALMTDGDASPYLDSQRHAHIQRMREQTKMRRNASLADALIIDNAIFHIEADLRWIDLTSSRLAKLKEELCR